MHLSRSGIRTGVLAGAAILAMTGTLVIAYELARARVPEHRAALERLVQAQTGLDVRFNELGLRWGWYGPEAVFRRVELGEPGRSNVLLRAPQLIVGFDAWRTMQTGQLVAGRITLVAPDIDLERLTQGPRASTAGVRAKNIADAARASRNRLLERWRGGRIDLEGGTLRLPDPNGSTSPIIVQVRRASLRRSENEWNGFGLVFLPERLGRAARIAVQVQGDLNRPQTLTGGVRFEGMRLAFAGWREVLNARPSLARSLPATGNGDITLQLTLKNGRVDKANGQVKANDLTFGTPPWIDPAHAAYTAHGVLKLEYLSGDWRFVRRGTGGQIQVEQLVLSREDRGTPLPRISVELGRGHVHGTLARAPLRSAADVAQWLAPSLMPSGVLLSGTAENIDFDWNDARPEGSRLAASARVDDAIVASSSGSFALSGLSTRLSGSESRVAIELEAPAARLELETTAEPLHEMKLASVLQIARSDDGWRLSTDRLSVDYDGGQLTLSGTLSGTEGIAIPVLDARGTMTHPNIANLHSIVANSAARTLGPAVTRLTAGRIEAGRFELTGPVDELFVEPTPVSGPASLGMPTRSGDSFKGSLTLRDARLAADGAWPEMRAVDAKLEWDGPRIHASVDEGRAGAFDLEGLEAQWDASGARSSHVAGRARARVEKALAWVRANPEVQEYAPHLQDLDARGDALFDFDIVVPADSPVAPRGTPAKASAHVAAVLEGVALRLTPELPPVESLRGSIAFDDGRLQRSTLTGIWQGSPLTLRVSERRDQPGAIAVQAQGVIDANKVVALSQFQDLANVAGEAVWSGEFSYVPASGTEPALWEGRADSSLVGIASDLPSPLGKAANATLPLHVELSGSADLAEVHAKLGDRVRSTFALKPHEDGRWQIEQGDLRFGTGATAIDVNLQADERTGTTLVRVASESVGLLTGTLVTAKAPGINFTNVQWSKEALAGEGEVRCAARLATCEGEFELTTDSAARALAGLGFRADVAAAKGELSGKLSWHPRADRSWMATVSGRVSMRLDDGISRTDVSTSGQPFPLLTVPALLSVMARPGLDAVPSGELRFKRLDAEFELRDGQAYTSNLHFDGDAEILMRGRTGLLARDYDYEAWVLRGEERIPSSLRRLAATPRVAAAWVALRELVRGESADRSHVVLHLRGSWSEPLVTVD
jgi:uncharacterized protein YhdP